MTNKIQLNALQKILIWSAGADHEVLARKSCLIERYKYESIGTTVLLTSIMAFFSGGYALFTIFGSLAISCTIGLIWSLVIFNLDRFFILTSSRNKSGSIFQFAIASSLRLSIAIVLSVVVAKPLELRLFEKEINQEIPNLMAEKQRDERRKQQDEWKNSSESRSIDEIKQEMDSLNSNKQILENKLGNASLDVIKEIEGSGGSGKPGRGNVYNEKEVLKKELRQQRADTQKRIEKLNNEENSLIKRREQRLGAESSTKQIQQRPAESSISLLDRILAVERLSNKNTVVSTTSKLIMLLLIIIEVSPILVKMFSKGGLYDELLQKEDNYRISKEKLLRIKEREILRLEELKDLELQIESFIIKYFRQKEKSQGKIENTGIYDTESNHRKYAQEDTKFLIKLCRERVEYLSHKVLASDIDEDIVEELNSTQDGAKRR